MPECNVCAESFNKTNRCKVTCKCDYEACRSCIKTYLLDKTEDAHCMSCKVGWDRAFMSTSFEKSFMTKNYKSHREQILIERELGMLQATQPYVEREIKLEKLSAALQELTIKYHQERQALQDEFSGNTTVERKKFVRKCPNGDCHGFLSSALKCELCENFACGDCREVTGKTTEEREAHVCDAQIVESVKFLEKDSKPCPNCTSMTFKIIGCSQMYCVECHTPWDWNSGRIVTGQIHNPHYIEYLAQQNKGQAPRNPNEIRCGREIDIQFLQKLLEVFPRTMAKDWTETTNWRGRIEYYNRKTGETTRMYPFKEGTKSDENFAEIARNIIHIRHVELARFNQADQLQDNLQMRIDFMRNKIEKEDFKKKIQKKEKEAEKKNEIANVLGMYMNCMTDIFYRLIDNPKDAKKIQAEMQELRSYSNKCFVGIGKSFNGKTHELYKNFVFC